MLNTNKLLGQGSYGCVYYPGIDCKANSKKNSKYVTKIQESDNASKNEIYISKIIRKNIKDYDKYLIVIVKHCKISVNKLHDKQDNLFNQCEFLEDMNHLFYRNVNDIYLTYSRYLQGSEFLLYYNQYYNKRFEYLDYVGIIENYKRLNYSCNLLSSNNIVHNDMHSSNLMIKKSNNKIYIIDFGLAYVYSNKKNNIKQNFDAFFISSNSEFNIRLDHCFNKLFYRYITYLITKSQFIHNISTIDYHNIKDTVNFLTLENITEFSSSIENIINKKLYKICSVTDVKQIISFIQKYYNRYTDKSVFKTIGDVLIDIYNDYEYIDQYSCNYLYINMYNQLYDKIVNKPYYNIIEFFKQLWIAQLNPDKKLRLTYNETIMFIDFILDLIKNYKIIDKFIRDKITDFIKHNNLKEKFERYNFNYSLLFT